MKTKNMCSKNLDETHNAPFVIPRVCRCSCGGRFYAKRHRIGKENRVKCPYCNLEFAWGFIDG